MLSIEIKFFKFLGLVFITTATFHPGALEYFRIIIKSAISQVGREGGEFYESLNIAW